MSKIDKRQKLLYELSDWIIGTALGLGTAYLLIKGLGW